jgi:hypothetical protein
MIEDSIIGVMGWIAEQDPAMLLIFRGKKLQKFEMSVTPVTARGFLGAFASMSTLCGLRGRCILYKR